MKISIKPGLLLVNVFFVGIFWMVIGNKAVAAIDYDKTIVNGFSTCMCYVSSTDDSGFTSYAELKGWDSTDEAECKQGCANMGAETYDYSTDVRIAKDYDPVGTMQSPFCCASGKTCAPSAEGGVCAGGFNKISCDACLPITGSPAPAGMPGASVTGNTTSSSGTTTSTTGSTVSAPIITNPIAYDSVEGFLMNFLGVLQKVIVLLSLIFIVIGAVMYIVSAGTGLMETAKKTITAAIVGLALGMAAPSFLKEISDIMGWTGETAIDPGTLSITQIATNVLTFLLGAIGILAIMMLVLGGSMYLTSAGNEDRIDTGKKIVKNSIIGIVISLSAMVLVRQLARFFM